MNSTAIATVTRHPVTTRRVAIDRSKIRGRGTRPTQMRAPTPLRRPMPQRQSDDVRDLIEAAGPLDVANIAGGLDWPIDEAHTFVSSLVSDGQLQQDEFDRFRLAGDWR